MKPNLENYKKFEKIYKIFHKYGYLLWKYGTDNNIEIEDIGVDIRRHGYGRKLIKALVEEVRKSSPKIIFVYTKEDNKTARPFYEAIGFQKGGQMGDNILYWQFYEKL